MSLCSGAAAARVFVTGLSGDCEKDPLTCVLTWGQYLSQKGQRLGFAGI